MAEENVIRTATEFLDKIRGSDKVTVKFRKKTDNSVRIMNCTLKFDHVPESKKPKDVNLSKILKLLYDRKIIHVFDLDRQDWRSIPFDRAEWVEDQTQTRYRIVR